MLKKIVALTICVFLIAEGRIALTFAQTKYSLSEITPPVEEALENRRNRYHQLGEMKKRGEIGENNRGYIEALVDSEEINTLVDEENQDREIIYEAIAKQNDLGGNMEVIEKVFAQVQREKAKSGEKIENENGEWMDK